MIPEIYNRKSHSATHLQPTQSDRAGNKKPGPKETQGKPGPRKETPHHTGSKGKPRTTAGTQGRATKAGREQGSATAQGGQAGRAGSGDVLRMLCSSGRQGKGAGGSTGRQAGVLVGVLSMPLSFTL